jgi:hypothetical protein
LYRQSRSKTPRATSVSLRFDMPLLMPFRYSQLIYSRHISAVHADLRQYVYLMSLFIIIDSIFMTFH